MDGSREMEAIW